MNDAAFPTDETTEVVVVEEFVDEEPTKPFQVTEQTVLPGPATPRAETRRMGSAPGKLILSL